MKKVFLFTCLSALALTFNSCSDDDSSSSNNNNGQTGGTVTFKVDGVQKTFNTVTVDTESETVEGETWEWYEVTASNSGSSSELISFSVDKGSTGADAMYDFGYTINNQQMSMDWDAFSSNTTANNNDKLKGTFSGTVIRWDNATQTQMEKEITDGNFDINL